MEDYISGHVMDLLQNDPILRQAGNSWPTPFLGVKRIEAGDAPLAMNVNLFDRAFQPDSRTARPAIYLGTTGMGTNDDLIEDAIAGTTMLQYRKVTIPLIVAATADKWKDARGQRSQLVANILRILFKHAPAETGYWWDLDVPGMSGGGMSKKHMWESATQSGVEAYASIPVVFSYSWTPTSPA